MIDANEILNVLKKEYEKSTYQQMAKKYGIAYTYLYDIMRGKYNPDSLTLKKINKMFPDAVLHLYGDKVTITAPQNQGNVVGVNNGAIGGDCLSAVLDKLLATDELTAEEKVKVIKVLKR